MIRFLMTGVAAMAISTAAVAQTPPPHMPADLSPAGVRAADEHLALEQVEGAEAMAFVHAENEKSLAVLTGDPRYETFRQQAFDILSATDRIPQPGFLGDGIGNFWQDAANPKGVWRRTTLDSYRSADPRWEVLLDIDALSKAEGKDWVWKGADCLAPDETRCLISLSDGGKDAVVVREFDTTTRQFVDGGFRLPEGKHRLEWLDHDTLLVATDFGPENGQATLTESGYPYIVKTLKRGQTLAEATEVYRGDISDGGYGVSPSVYRDGSGVVQAVLFTRPLDTFRQETWEWVDAPTGLAAPADPSARTALSPCPHGADRSTCHLVKLALPERVNVRGAANGFLIFSIDEDWRLTPGHPLHQAGSLLAYRLPELGHRTDAYQIDATAVVFEPGARQSLEEVAVMDDRVVATLYDNVRGRLIEFVPAERPIMIGDRQRGIDHPWTPSAIPVPDNVSVHLGDRSRATGRFFYSVEGFLTPSTLSLVDTDAGDVDVLHTAPARFDASRDVVEQFEATSTDGTKIPYFVVRPKDAPMDGSTPTVMFGYGGFQVSYPPAYKPEMGKLWLENGGAFVIANIRGGGEFGPAWHQAALNENRQRAFDDFAAVARDLETRGITSPRRLGIYGRSNGGVLTSVTLTQHPELIHAAVIESPLVDMLRYWELPAGASWIGEYGDPRIPEEAAWIARYSGYQNLRPGQPYPRVYITTNTRDDRVHPGHARKFAARLGDMGYDRLYYEETAGGHSNDADPVANARRWARHYVYLAQQLMD